MSSATPAAAATFTVALCASISTRSPLAASDRRYGSDKSATGSASPPPDVLEDRRALVGVASGHLLLGDGNIPAKRLQACLVLLLALLEESSPARTTSLAEV
jgi:hypothetical protein